MTELKPGDRVEWDSSGGHSVGKVVEKVTKPTAIKGHKVAASPENPEFIVESDKGGKAAHKPEALKKSTAKAAGKPKAGAKPKAADKPKAAAEPKAGAKPKAAAKSKAK